MRELHERAAAPGVIEAFEPLSNCPVRLDIAKQALPGRGSMIGTACGIRQAARSRAAASGSADDLLIAINLRVGSIIQQDDQELKRSDAMPCRAGDSTGLFDYSSWADTFPRFTGPASRGDAAGGQIQRYAHPTLAAQKAGALPPCCLCERHRR